MHLKKAEELSPGVAEAQAPKQPQRAQFAHSSQSISDFISCILLLHAVIVTLLILLHVGDMLLLHVGDMMLMHTTGQEGGQAGGWDGRSTGASCWLPAAAQPE